MNPREQRYASCSCLAFLVLAAALYTILVWWLNPPGLVTLPPQPK